MKRILCLVMCLAVVIALPFGAQAGRGAGSGSRQEAEVTRVVHGNAKSRIYHNASCRYFNCKACTVIFRSASEARAGGYRACRVCGG